MPDEIEHSETCENCGSKRYAFEACHHCGFVHWEETVHA
jgi:ribosomal protein L37E